MGDGSFGFNAMELDTAVRHNLPVVVVLGNNSIWGNRLADPERPVRETGMDRSAALRGTTSSRRGLGAYGEHVTRAADLAPALTRAFASNRPALVNVEIDQVISPVAEAAINRKLGTH